ncbi:MAG: glycoside hydrolase family 3 N-terminal domain-containing protein, partial [Streptosporangiales bacterium]
MERAGTPVRARAAQAAQRARADGMLSQLTDAEKIAMLHQWSPGVPRLGIAPFRTGTEALHGAAWHGAATVFPQAVGLGATWDPDLLTEVGTAVSTEVRALHQRDALVSLNVWAPVVNLLRDPRWGRNEEGYSEDPLFTARLAVAYCTGLRGDHPVFWRTSPLLKHFFAHNNETGRDTSSSVIRPRVLHEYDLPPFRGPVAAGVAGGVMPSYNLVNGRPNHVSPYLNDLLRRWTSDELVVCSDAQAPSNLVDTEHYFADHADSHAAALRAGVDSFTDHDGDSGVATGRITEGLRRGLITMADVDRAVRRLLLLRLRLGEFDPGLDPYRAAGRPVLDAAHRDLARRAARQSFVLLKNDAGLLPLDPAPGLRLAVAGPFADTLRTDWYSGTMPYQVTVAAGLRDALAGTGGTVTVAEGADRVRLAAAGGRGPDLGEFDVFDWGPGTLGTVVTFRSAATGRYLTVAEDGALAADAARPGGWVVRETFTVQEAPARPDDEAGGAPAGEEPAHPGRLVVLRATATGRYVAAGDTPGELRASAPAAAGAQR